jgi:hypothetical protein
MIYGKSTVERRSKEGIRYHNVLLTADGANIIPSGGLGSVNLNPEGKIIDKVIIVDDNEKPLPIIPSMYKNPIILERTISISEYFHYEIDLSYVFIAKNIVTLKRQCEKLFEEGKLFVFKYAYYDTTEQRESILIPKENNIFVLVGSYKVPELLQPSDIHYYDELLDEALQEELLFEVW